MSATSSSTPLPSEEAELNASAMAALRDLLEYKPIAFVGAGISARCGYPTWRGLMLQMRAALDADRNVLSGPKQEMKSEQESDLLWFAQEMRELLGRDRYLELLYTQFRSNDRKPDECARAIVRLPFRHLVTTNYDETLEHAHTEVFGLQPPMRSIPWENSFEVRDWLMRLADTRAPRSIVHLHGTYRDPANIVLTDEDYEKRYSAHDGSARKLFALFATQRVVFLGFSLSDPDLMRVLQQIKANLGPGGAAHLALLPSPEASMRPYLRRRLRGKFGVEALFYEWDHEHTRLAQILGQLASEHAARQAATTTSAGDVKPRPPALASLVAPPSVPTAAVETDPDDPQRGRWGGLSIRDQFLLSASVAPRASARTAQRSWFDVTIEVHAPQDGRPLTEAVFHLHPTFHPSIVRAPFRDGVARHTLVSYGAFTVGAVIPERDVRLELNLAQLPGAPDEFKRN